jgi:microcystin-dependent protein
MLLAALSMSASDTELRSAEGRVGPADQRPLTEQEFQLLQRLLSDPFSFPIAYKTWLVSYLETSDLSLPISAIQGLSTILGISSAGQGSLGIFPAGIILPYGGVSAPVGSVMCDGTAYSRTGQKRLYDAIGTAYGAPDGSTFLVPDLQERVPVGRGVLAGHNVLGQSDGLPKGSRGVKHNHGSHSHIQQRMNFSLTPGSTAYSLNAAGTIDGPSTSTVTIGSGNPVDGSAYLIINFIIIT